MPLSALPRLLADAPWMHGLSPAARDRVCEDAFETRHGAGEMIACRGQPVQCWLGVEEGLLKVVSSLRTGKAVIFSGMPAGSWFGEGSVMKHEPYHYDIVTMRHATRVVHIPRATFVWLLGSSFEFNRFIIDHLNARLAQFMGTIETDRMTDPGTKVARAIAGLFNPVLYPRMDVLLRMSQEEIGELAGLTRQRANGAIRELTAQGLIQARYGGLRVLDLPGLRQRAARAE